MRPRAELRAAADRARELAHTSSSCFTFSTLLACAALGCLIVGVARAVHGELTAGVVDVLVALLCALVAVAPDGWRS